MHESTSWASHLHWKPSAAVRRHLQWLSLQPHGTQSRGGKHELQSLANLGSKSSADRETSLAKIPTISAMKANSSKIHKSCHALPQPWPVLHDCKNCCKFLGFSAAKASYRFDLVVLGWMLSLPCAVTGKRGFQDRDQRWWNSTSR